MPGKYSNKTQDHVATTMRKMKKGELKIGSGETVKRKDQAVAIALSEARDKNYKAPEKSSAKNSSTKDKTSNK